MQRLYQRLLLDSTKHQKHTSVATDEVKRQERPLLHEIQQESPALAILCFPLSCLNRGPLVIRTQKEYQHLQAFYEEVQDMLTWPEPRLYSPVPVVSAWSPAQHLHHVATSNAQILKSLLKTCNGEAPPASEGRANLVGMLVLALGRMPRGRGQTPRRFEPPDLPARNDLDALLTRSRATLEALEPHLPAFSRLPGRWRHKVFGPLNAQQIFRFARIHAMHHLYIIRDIDNQRPAAQSSAVAHSQATL